MALKIIRSTDVIRVERLNVVVYAPPGLGKSSLAFTAAEPLMLDFDLGSHRALRRKDVVRVSAWPEVADISAEDLAPYKTAIVDTAGRALDVLTADIIRRNPKANAGGGVLSLKGFGQLKGEFIAWIKMVNSFGLDVVLVVHMDESRKGDELIERLDITGGSKGEIYKSADAMGRIQMIEGRRVLNFNPSDTAFGKNPGQLPPLDVPHPDKDPAFLAGVIALTKAKLNELTAEQTKAAALVEEWSGKIQAFQTLQAFNAAIPEVKQQPRTVQALFGRAATAAGYVFDKEAGKYTAPVEPEAAGAPESAAAAEPSTEPAQAASGAPDATGPTFGDLVETEADAQQASLV
jgi:hypothetical protein